MTGLKEIRQRTPSNDTISICIICCQTTKMLAELSRDDRPPATCGRLPSKVESGESLILLESPWQRRLHPAIIGVRLSSTLCIWLIAQLVISTYRTRCFFSLKGKLRLSRRVLKKIMRGYWICSVALVSKFEHWFPWVQYVSFSLDILFQTFVSSALVS